MENKMNFIDNIVKKLCVGEINSYLQIELQYPLGNSNNVQKVVIVNVSERNKGKVLSFVLKALEKSMFRNYFVNCYHNELTLYTILLPQFVRKDSKYTIADCLDAKPSNLNEIGVAPTYLALENLCEKGFKMSARTDVLKRNETLCASLEHNKKSKYLHVTKVQKDKDQRCTTISVSALGQFHGDCYSFKMLTPHKYNEVMSKLIRLHAGNEGDEYHSSWLIMREVLFYYSIQKFMKTCNDINLVQKAKYLIDILDTVGLLKSMEHVSKPREPLSVLCHGDINRSNIMFQYDRNNVPISCAFIDFQLSSVSSPAKDLFSLIFLNIKDSEERRNMWSDIWCTYWEALVNRICKNTMRNINDLPLEFSVTSLQEDFSYNCYAYLPNIITFIYSYCGNKKYLNIHKEHVKAKKRFIEKNGCSVLKTKTTTITVFDYNFFLNTIEHMENNEVKMRLNELLKEYFTHYYCEYPLSIFGIN